MAAAKALSKYSVCFDKVKKDQITVALVSVYPYLERDRSVGGVNQAVYQLVRALDQLDSIELHVVTHGRVKSYTRSHQGRNTTLHVYPAPNLGYDSLLLYHGRRVYVHNLLRQIKPDLVHAQEQPADILAGIQSPYPHIVTVHGLYREFYRANARSLTLSGHLKSLIPVMVEAYNFRRMRNLIAITEEIARLARRVSPKMRIFRINNPIDNAFFTVPELNINTAPTILFAGLIIYRKGVDVLLEAMRSIRTVLPDVKVRLVGSTDEDAKYVASLRTRYADLFTSGQAVLAGLADKRTMLTEYARCSLLCLPSRAESAPMVIAEAMAASRPVVATSVGGIPEMIEDGVTGKLCQPDNPEQLADCLLSLLQDKGTLQEMSVRARQVAAQRYRSDSVAEATMDAYLTILRALP